MVVATIVRLATMYDSLAGLAKEFNIVVTPIKTQAHKVVILAQAGLKKGKQAPVMKGPNNKRLSTPLLAVDAPFVAIMTPIKKSNKRDETTKNNIVGKEIEQAIELSLSRGLPQLLPKIGIGRKMGPSSTTLTSSGDDLLEDALEAWTKHEENVRDKPTKEESITLLESIGNMVDKVEIVDHSLEEDRRDFAIDIKELEKQINSNSKASRRAANSLETGLHYVLDSQNTPSHLAPKWKKSHTTRVRIILEIPPKGTAIK